MANGYQLAGRSADAVRAAEELVRTSAKLSQKDQLFFSILLAVPPAPYSFSSPFERYGIVTGCKGRASTTDSGSTFKWSYSCRDADDVMSQVNVPVGSRR